MVGAARRSTAFLTRLPLRYPVVFHPLIAAGTMADGDAARIDIDIAFADLGCELVQIERRRAADDVPTTGVDRGQMSPKTAGCCFSGFFREPLERATISWVRADECAHLATLIAYEQHERARSSVVAGSPCCRQCKRAEFPRAGASGPPRAGSQPRGRGVCWRRSRPSRPRRRVAE
jgi:hypothetical protein